MTRFGDAFGFLSRKHSDLCRKREPHPFVRSRLCWRGATRCARPYGLRRLRGEARAPETAAPRRAGADLDLKFQDPQKVRAHGTFQPRKFMPFLTVSKALRPRARHSAASRAKGELLGKGLWLAVQAARQSSRKARASSLPSAEACSSKSARSANSRAAFRPASRAPQNTQLSRREREREREKNTRQRFKRAQGFRKKNPRRRGASRLRGAGGVAARAGRRPSRGRSHSSAHRTRPW